MLLLAGPHSELMVREVTSTVDAAQLELAVNALHEAARILVVGVGTSAPLAQDFAYRLMSIGFHTPRPR
ncbi:hypothetical protein ABZ897_21295 [Nonomuraea sp. NPDC046802]|uniref:hypothetical protein n=1 Tax=Nonomuraea sp. NPDC046802 TaxID=3154919 RepID=UPI0033E3A5F2